MEKKASRWLIGCGMGCAGVIVLVVAFLIGSAYLVRSTTKGFQAAVETHEELDRKFGKVDEFRPWTDGSIPAARVEAFLTVRDQTQPARAEIERYFRALPMSRGEAEKIDNLPFWQKAKRIWSLAGTGIGLGGSIGEFFKARNEALLRAEMGLGEYTFLYVLAYNSWLKKNPNDGVQGLHGEVRIDTHRFERNLHDRLVTMLEAQHEAAPEGAWKDRLSKELEALRGDPSRVPWQDGLPTATEKSLNPFRERLEQTYNPVTNEFELSISRRQGSFGFRTD